MTSSTLDTPVDEASRFVGAVTKRDASSTEERLRVLVTASTFPQALNDGHPRFVYDLACVLGDIEDVRALVPDAPTTAAHERLGPLDVHRFRYFPKDKQHLAYGPGIRENLKSSWWAKLSVPAFFWSQARAISRIVKEEGIDVVNSHWLIPQGLSAAYARGRSHKFTHVLHLHAGDVYLLRKLTFGRRIARYVVDRCDALFADGSGVRDALDELIGRPSGAVLQPMGVNCRLFREPNGGPATSRFPDGYLLFFGRFVEKKGVQYLIQAMPEVLKRHPGLGLVLVGYGPLEESYRREAERLGITNALEFVGRKPHDQIVRYLHGCRASVVPSVYDSVGEADGMPTVVLESLATGAKVVGTTVGGIADVIQDGVNGWMCKPNDPVSLARSILQALDAPQNGPVREAALATAADFDWPRLAARYAKRLHEAHAQAHSPRRA